MRDLGAPTVEPKGKRVAFSVGFQVLVGDSCFNPKTPQNGAHFLVKIMMIHLTSSFQDSLIEDESNNTGL